MRWRWCSFAMVLAGAAFGLTGSAARPTPAASPVPIPVLAAVTTPHADPWAGAADLFFKVAARDDAIPDAGLPRAVAEDGDGFIWLGTDGGLARWDGTGFKTYSTEPADGAGALPELMVNTLFTDRSGRLWLGMSAEGLLWRDPLTDSFHRPPNRTPLDRAHVVAIIDDDAGGLWVGSEAGLSHIRGSDHHATLVTGLPPGRIGAVHRDRNGRLWVGDESRLFRRDATGGFVAVPVPGVVGVITALHADDQGRLWIATAGSGFHVIAADGSIRHLPVTVDGHNVPLGAMIDAGNGEIWTASRAGIVGIDPATMRMRRLAHDPYLPASLAENGLNHVMRDRSGLVWIVGDATLSYVDPAPRRVLGLVNALRADPRQQPDSVWSLGVAPDGALWYGSADIPGSRLAPAPAGGLAPPQRLPAAVRNVQSIAFAADAAFTAGESGLFRLSLDGRRAQRLSAQSWSRVLLRGDQLYVGNGLGVALADARHPGPPRRLPWSDALTDLRVRSLAFTPDGLLWVGTARGLNRVDPASGRVVGIRPGDAGANALRANFVGTLLCDADGRLWAGTIGGGITIFGRSAGAWHAVAHLGRRQGLPHDTVDKLLLGSDGDVWASTDGGIARIDPASLTITPLHAADGVPFTAYWTGAGATLPDGRLVFAGFGGLTMIDPAAPSRETADAPLRFTAVRGNGKAFVPTPGRMLTIGAGERSLTADFARLDYAAARDQAYVYRLFPQETNWTRVDALHRSARYTNLPPGRSTLVVRALGTADRGSLHVVGAPLTLEIDVETLWYETTLFRIVAAAVIVATLLALLNLRLRAARKRERQLESLVERRTAELLVSQSELEKLAYTDTLTGLGNRRLYGEMLGRHLGGARHAPFGLLLIDLDRFKRVNDALGHDVGDALLIEVADRLSATIRQNDSIFRLGGDEFAIILAGLDGEPAIDEMCRRLYAAFAAPVTAGIHRLQVALSIGAVVARAEGMSTEAVYKLADLALYDAKRAGRGTWRLSPLDPEG